MGRLFALLLIAAPMVSTAAFAQDDIDDLDEGGDRGRESDRGGRQREEVVREIERGFYAKANVGSTSYFLNYGFDPNVGRSILRSGTQLGLALGSDFVDNENNSMSWEVAFSQGVHNGESWDNLSYLVRTGAVSPYSAIQGDTRTYAALAGIEYSIYPSRRIGIGVRAGGGVMFTPLLMHPVAFNRDVIPEFQVDLLVHRSPHPLGYGGPTIEYYTKLSHFSVGADADVMYAVGFDLGVAATGYMKYTF